MHYNPRRIFLKHFHQYVFLVFQMFSYNVQLQRDIVDIEVRCTLKIKSLQSSVS